MLHISKTHQPNIFGKKRY